MARSDIEVVTALLDAYGSGGFEAAAPWLDPDVEWQVRDDLPDAGVYRGRQGVAELLGRFDEVMEDIWYRPHNVTEKEGRVVVELEWGGRGRGSGVPFEEREETWVFEVENEKVVRVDEYATLDAATASLERRD